MTKDLQVTVYKQIPGADIEPGWWAVVHPSWHTVRIHSDRWLGPYRTKREANAAGKQALSNQVKGL